ncbi:hypothetical protein NUACC21_53610 [Scytonema sp. NUACC21]
MNPKNKYVTLQIPGYKHPIFVRYQSSDVDVLYQIFGEEEYSVLNAENDYKVILDCGANVGYSSIYLLNKFPNAHVIAVEPDKDNFQVCQKNLLPYSDRVTLIRAGVWSHEVGLVLRHYGNGNEWGTQVEECQDKQQPDLLAKDIPTLLEESGHKSVDLLKMDVEGAETVIFSQNYQSWLSKVKNIVIELHGKECEEAFFNALSYYEYKLSRSGELTVCQSIKAKAVLV